MTTLPPLSAEHRALLNGGGISDAVIDARGYGTARAADADLLARLGHPRGLADAGDVLLLPVHDVYGSALGVIARPDRPEIDARGKRKKYRYPRSHSMLLDVHPFGRPFLSDAAVPIIVVEGQKKADAAYSHGAQCVIALAGVFCWKSAVLTQWDAANLKRRLVYLIFDSDAQTNPKVRAALRRLRGLLIGWGAEVRVVTLASGPEGAKTGLDDALVAGAALEALLADATVDLRAPTVPRIHDPRQPLDVTCPDRHTLAEAFGVVAQHGVFRTETGTLLALIPTAEGHRLDPLDSAADVRSLFDRHLRSFTRSRDGDERPQFLPRDVAEMAVHEASPELPVCRGLLTAPAFTADGRLLDQPGYDAESGFYYSPGRFTPRPVAPRPSAEELAEARRWWDDELLADFPFASDSDRTAALALALSLLVRGMIGGQVPLFLATAPTPGSGKGKLVTVALLPILGPGQLITAAWPKGEEETRKRLFAMLLGQPRAALFDNVSGRVESSAFALVLTAPNGQWHERVLGQSETRAVPCRTVWVMTGNNAFLSDELAQRRTLPVRLIPQTAHPEQRTGFRHPNLEQWATDHRADLLWALCCFVRHWQAMGCPDPTTPTLGSFEQWCRVVGGILQAAGYSGFLANRSEWTAQADPDTERWERFTAEWFRLHGGTAVATSTLVELAENADAVAFDDSANERARATSVGRALAKRADRFFGHHQIKQGRVGTARTWYLKTHEPTDTSTLPTPPHLPPANVRERQQSIAIQNTPYVTRLSAVSEVSKVSGGDTACAIHNAPQRQRSDGMWRCPECCPNSRWKPTPASSSDNGHGPDSAEPGYWDSLLASGEAS